jgi:hypothetical protein
MPYPDLPAGRYGVGAPLDISDGKKLWSGDDKTNGFLMRSVDGRIPALEESFSKLVLAVANPMFDDGVVPWGNALWLDLANIDTQPHTMHGEKPTLARIAGVLKFDQGWQTGNPVQNYGLPLYSKGALIRNGLVGYKVSLAVGADVEDYAAYLTGDSSQDVPATRTTYAEWVAALKTGPDGGNLAIFFENTSGFPLVTVVSEAMRSAEALVGSPGTTYSQADFSTVAVSLGNPVLAGHTFGGYAKVFEPENKAVFFDLAL